ncbi:hypothetical protein EPUL_006779, partial [Erysiphe pulchra]
MYMEYGPHFGDITKAWAVSQGIVWCNSPVAAKKPTGMIEKTVDVLQRVLKKKSLDPKNWPEYVQNSVFEVNRREIAHLLYSPSEIFLGFSLAGSLETKFPILQRQNMSTLLKNGDDTVFPTDDEHCCKAIDFILSRTQKRRKVLDASDLAKDKSAQKHDLGIRVNHKFNPGNLVMLYDHRESGKKLRATWRGPFIITGFGGDTGRSYTLRQINGKPIPRHYHGDSIKPFRLREGYIATNKEPNCQYFKISDLEKRPSSSQEINGLLQVILSLN